MSLILRQADQADIPAILGFIRDLADYEHLLPTVEATEERLRQTLFPAEGRPYAECVLALVDARPVGFALHFTSYSTFLAKPGLYLEDLFVQPAYRGRGIGRALVTHLARIACERGYGRMDWTVLDWNSPAIAFYRSLGADLIAEWRICRLTGPSLLRYA